MPAAEARQRLEEGADERFGPEVARAFRSSPRIGALVDETAASPRTRATPA